MKEKSICIQIFLQCFILTLSRGLIQKLNLDTRIVGGEDADIRNHSYQVSLQFSNNHFCGGALIDNDMVVTAAHCFGKSYSTISSFYTVKYGSNTTSDGFSAQIQSVLVHPEYDDKTINNDIAIVQLRANVTLSDYVSLIRLSERNTYKPETLATVSGWGYTAENDTVLSSVLKKADVPITAQAQCRKYYEEVVEITNKMICAGFDQGGKDACQGDSGGPLVQNNQLIGLVSFGVGCARSNYPGVYTNVAQLVDWVAANSDYQLTNETNFDQTDFYPSPLSTTTNQPNFNESESDSSKTNFATTFTIFKVKYSSVFILICIMQHAFL